MKRAWITALLLAAGCTGNAELFVPPAGEEPGSNNGGGEGGGAGGGAATGDLSNLDVYTRLKFTCGGCHSLTERPYFQSLESFENLIVYDESWIVPKDPDNSQLLQLLNASLVIQMPPAPGDSFVALEGKQLTQITMAELRQWILGLEPRTKVTPTDLSVVKRKTAEQVTRALYDQLGLNEQDFYKSDWYPKANDSYAVRSPDGIPFTDAYEQGGTLFTAMGGPHWLEGKWRNDTQTASFAQALTHVSQAWCRTAFSKTGNTAVWTKATAADVSSTTTGAANIRGNIADLYLRMLGEDATTAEVDDLFNNVFVKYESKGAVTAWTAVCSSLVRDPLWILY